jgi:hypothetical protein
MCRRVFLQQSVNFHLDILSASAKVLLTTAGIRVSYEKGSPEEI